MTEHDRVARQEAPRPHRWWRGLTGTLAAGLGLVALVMIGAQIVAMISGAPGPGLFPMIAHIVAAIAAVLAQRLVDRRVGPVAGTTGAGIVVLTVVMLWIFWLA